MPQATFESAPGSGDPRGDRCVRRARGLAGTVALALLGCGGASEHRTDTDAAASDDGRVAVIDAGSGEGRDATADDARSLDAPAMDGRADDGRAGDAARPPVFAKTPLLPGDHPDPHVLRTTGADGKPLYVLTATVDTGDFAAWTSRDLLTWSKQPKGLFGGAVGATGATLDVQGKHHCGLWAPEIVELGPSAFMLNFTARRYATARACPAYAEDSGVYLAWSASPTGPFADAAHPWEPLPAGAQISSCSLRGSLPRSLDLASSGCQGTYCHHVMRLDSTVFRDGARWFSAYAWYTNSPPLVDWEKTHLGEHVNLVELDAKDPFAVRCASDVLQISIADPHDGALRAALASSCLRCGEQLSFTKGRFDEDMARAGYSWGVAEAPSVFRRGAWVYALFSHSAWDSAYYAVSWVAAKTVEGLATGSPGRLAGRYLVPSKGQSFGHGAPVLGPDGEHWYYVHHHLDHAPCKASGACGRDVWLSPLEFEDRGDGKGDVYIRARFPAEAGPTPVWPG